MATKSPPNVLRVSMNEPVNSEIERTHQKDTDSENDLAPLRKLRQKNVRLY